MFLCFQTLNTKNHDTESKTEKRTHYTADKTLTSLQRLSFKMEKMAVLSLNCLKKYSSPPKLNLKHLEAQNAVNLRTYEFVMITQQKEKKCISLQICLVLFSVFFKEQKRQSNAAE